MKKTVTKIVDLSNLPPLTEEQRGELAALAVRGDETIDFSDIPPMDEDAWRGAVRGPLHRPVKESTTVRIDRDVLIWLKSQGRGYQTRLNAILRREMLSAMKRGGA